MKQIFFFLFCIPVLSWAQVDADFTVSDSSGCCTLMVNITNQSTGTGMLTFSWNFGNGQTSSLEDPWAVNYLVPGIYTITLTVSNGSSTDVHTQLIQVFASPVVQISTNSTTGCAIPLDVQFTNNATGPLPMQYQWDFGDGNSSTLQNPMHQYSAYGAYSVSLTVTDSNGCIGHLVSHDYIVIQEAVADFTVISTDTSCYPFVPIIYNLSPTDYSPQYNWNFGDGFVSQSQHPTHTYIHSGDYWLTYTITTSAGCTDSDSVMIHVGGPFANISLIPDSICLGEEVVITMTDSINIQSVNWSFGDGSGSHDISTSHIYSYSPPNGMFFIYLLYCSEPTCCMVAQPDSIFVGEANTLFSFSASPSGGNSVPINVQFTNNTTGNSPLQFLWDFGDGGSSTQQNPLHTYVNFGVYNVSLTVIDNFGCTSDTTITGMIVITDVYAPFNSTAGNITVFPNPSNDFAIIELPEFSRVKDLTLIIYDVNGNIVKTEKIKATQTKIDVSGFSKGIYFLKVLSEKGVTVTKMIVQ